MNQETTPPIRLRLWAEGDFPLLEKLLGDAEMTKHLGGPENAEQLARRHKRYVDLTDPVKSQMYVIVLDPGSAPVGSVGYWETDWQGQPIYEMGWSVLPDFQGQGIAVKATLAALANVRLVAQHRFVHAFPSVANNASNAVCRKAGFSLIGEVEFEYPKGHPMRCNDWQLDLLETH